MPEHRARLHRRRPAVPETAPGGEHERHREPDEGAEDVQGMSPDQRVERGTVRAGRDRQPVADQACPLIALDQEEERAEARSEEHTSELQSQSNLVCRLLLEKKKKIQHDVNPQLITKKTEE